MAFYGPYRLLGGDDLMRGGVVNIGDTADKRWISDNLRGLPYKFRRPLIKRYSEKFDDEGRRAANLFLLSISESVDHTSWSMASSDEDLISWADRRSDSARKIAGKAEDEDMAYLWLCDFCEKCGIPPEETSEQRTVMGAVARMSCGLWWRRRVRCTQARKVESAAIRLGLVSNRAGIYASDEALDRRRQQKSRNRNMLEAVLAVNELGQSYTLAELADLSVSNPVIRRGELMVRMAGFEKTAERSGHVGDFYTWTTPSRMHWNSDKYDGTTPRQSQEYLCKQWAKARAAMKRADINIYGFRVAEPHHDGTPHWHMLFFMAEKDRSEVRAILRRYALQVDGNEHGASKHRFTVVPIDKNKGTAAGYLAKYVAKNIDAFGVDYVDEDTTGKRDPRECAARVDAWASTWGIRQFQSVGGPPVTVWRELRRLDGAQECEHIERARAKADVGDWDGFIAAMESRRVGLAKRVTGECNRYKELKGPEITGVRCGAVVVSTRIHQWRIEYGARKLPFENKEGGVTGEGGKMVEEKPAAGGVDGQQVGLGVCGNANLDHVVEVPIRLGDTGFFGLAEGQPPWSPVNNCTGGKNETNDDGGFCGDYGFYGGGSRGRGTKNMLGSVPSRCKRVWNGQC